MMTRGRVTESRIPRGKLDRKATGDQFAKARSMDFPGDGGDVRFPADLGWLWRQRSTGLYAVAGERADDKSHHRAGWHNAYQFSGGCCIWLNGEHHSGIERAAGEGRGCAGLRDGWDRIAADFHTERGVQRSRDQCAGHADGHRCLGEFAGFEFDHPHADVDASGYCIRHTLKTTQ